MSEDIEQCANCGEYTNHIVTSEDLCVITFTCEWCGDEWSFDQCEAVAKPNDVDDDPSEYEYMYDPFYTGW